MNGSTKSQKVIKGADEIAKAIGASRPTLNNLVKIGFPAVYINGTLYSHIDAIDTFFETICKKHRGKELVGGDENEAPRPMER